MNSEKQKKFEEFYIKFVRKCLSENMLPTLILRYESVGVFPSMNYVEIDDVKKQEVLSSLSEEM